MKVTVTAVDEAVPNGEPAKKITLVGFVAADSGAFEAGQEFDAELLPVAAIGFDGAQFQDSTAIVETPAQTPGPEPTE